MRLNYFNRALLFFALVCFYSPLFSQTYFFKNFTVENGLPQSQVLSIFQDASGRLWIGTNQGGVARYDGNTFENITETNGLANNVVYSITQGDDALLYIGTNKGLSVYDGKKLYQGKDAFDWLNEKLSDQLDAANDGLMY